MYRRKYMIPAGLGVLMLAGIYFFADPAHSSFFPKCPFHALTGFDCPGCGSQRALHALFTGHFLQAADLNFLLVLSLPFLTGYFTARAFPDFKPGAMIISLFYRPFFPKLVFVVVMLFWIARNANFPLGRYLAA